MQEALSTALRLAFTPEIIAKTVQTRELFHFTPAAFSRLEEDREYGSVVVVSAGQCLLLAYGLSVG